MILVCSGQIHQHPNSCTYTLYSLSLSSSTSSHAHIAAWIGANDLLSPYTIESNANGMSSKNERNGIL